MKNKPKVDNKWVEEINKCLDKAVMRCKVLINSAKQPIITEVYLMQDLLEAKSFLSAYKEAITQTQQETLGLMEKAMVERIAKSSIIKGAMLFDEFQLLRQNIKKKMELLKIKGEKI